LCLGVRGGWISKNHWDKLGHNHYKVQVGINESQVLW
jgi:hypothetical protein